MCLKKTRYDTKKLAEAKMHVRQAAEKSPAEYLRAYRCLVCRGWHLTSKKS